MPDFERVGPKIDNKAPVTPQRSSKKVIKLVFDKQFLHQNNSYYKLDSR